MYVLFVICDCGVPVKLYNVKYTCFNYKTINIHTKNAILCLPYNSQEKRHSSLYW